MFGQRFHWLKRLLHMVSHYRLAAATASDDQLAIVDRIVSGKHAETDIAALRRLLSSSDRQSLLQLGKYGINVGQGQDIQIGDRIYKGADAETIRKIIQDELQSLPYGYNSQSVRNGLYALTELMAAPEVRAAVVGLPHRFSSCVRTNRCCGQLQRLA